MVRDMWSIGKHILQNLYIKSFQKHRWLPFAFRFFNDWIDWLANTEMRPRLNSIILFSDFSTNVRIYLSNLIGSGFMCWLIWVVIDYIWQRWFHMRNTIMLWILIDQLGQISILLPKYVNRWIHNDNIPS